MMKVNELEQTTGLVNLAVVIQNGTTGLTPVDRATRLYRSAAWWNIGNYDRFIGGRFSVHTKQSDDSNITGIISKIEEDPDQPGRAIVYFHADGFSGSGNKVSGKGLPWGQEKAIYR